MERRGAPRAYLQVVLAGSLWATGGPLSVALHRMGVPPDSVALLRPAAGAVLLAVLMAAVTGRRIFPERRLLLGMLVIGGTIVGVFQLAYQMSTASVGVPATVALLYLAPAFVVATSPLLFGERLGVAKGSLALLSILGVWTTVLGTRGVDVELTRAGILWGALCGISYGCYTLFGKFYSRAPGPLQALFWSTVGGTLLLTAVRLGRGVPTTFPDTPAAWTALLFLGFFTMVAAPLLLFDAMKRLEAGRASIGTTVEPVVAALLAMALLDQRLTMGGWLGMAILVAGVMGAYALRSPVREAPPPELEHP